jgi:pyruvate dehydrogenase E2 component (dihydrolipoamide acetyltransferase)
MESLMATLFAMPKLGMNMTEGTIVEWFAREGDQVEIGQALVAIETDKATQEVESPANGIVARILKDEGEIVPCNTVMAVIVGPGEEASEPIPKTIAEGVAPKAEVEVDAGRTEAVASQVKTTHRDKSQRISISPSARALAEEMGVDITKIVPQGSRIKRADVEAAYAAKKAGAAPSMKSSRKPMTTTRRTIAERMNQSARSVARVGLTLEADVTHLIGWRRRLESEGTEVSYNVLLAKLVALALQEYPCMNARLGKNAIFELDDIHIGIAVDAPHGLLVPVLREVDKKAVAVLQQEFAELTERALGGRSTAGDLEGGTFTLSNLGALGIEQFLPVINYPECAILGIGAILRKPVVLDDQVLIRPMMALTLAFDHRLVDGAPAARFLRQIKHLMEHLPES